MRHEDLSLDQYTDYISDYLLSLTFSMSIVIRPLEPSDLSDLSRFLTSGFRTSPEAEFAAHDLLAWKYFDPREQLENRPRSLIALDQRKIVGHLGLCFARFRDSSNSALDIPTLHMIDWLGSPEYRGIGVRMMRRANTLSPTQYGIGGTDAARRVTDRSRYELVSPISIYRRVLRQGYALKSRGTGAAFGLLQTAKGLASRLKHRPIPLALKLQMEPVEQFGQEIDSLLGACKIRRIYTARPPDLLNHLLRHPRKRIRGYLLILDDDIRGFAMLASIERDRVRIGQIVECFVDAPEEPGLLSSALGVLTQELHKHGADIASAFGGTPWMQKALTECGFYTKSHVNLYLRDLNHLIPRDAPFHVSPVEADYAYT